MSTRVEKASQKFKPVTRIKRRTAPQEASPSVEASLSNLRASVPTLLEELPTLSADTRAEPRQEFLIPDGAFNATSTTITFSDQSKGPSRDGLLLTAEECIAPDVNHDNKTLAASETESATIGSETHSQVRTKRRKLNLGHLTPPHNGTQEEIMNLGPLVNDRLARTQASTATIDISLDAGEPLDPTSTNMRDLCTPSTVGRVSSRHVEIQLAYSTSKKVERDRRLKLASALEIKEKHGDDTEERVGIGVNQNEEPLALPSAAINAPPEADLYGRDMTTSHYTVSMRMNASGQLVVDEDSLVVDRAADPTISAQESTLVHVEESDATRFVNSSTYSRKRRGSRWSNEETTAFYTALQQFNTDFTMISLMFPGRTAKECRNKFNSEDKKNKTGIDWALANPIAVDLDMLSRMSGKSFADG